MEPAKKQSSNHLGQESGRDLSSLALADFGPGFLDAAACDAWLARSLHPQGYVCPRCRAALPSAKAPAFLAFKRIACDGCGRRFTAASGTLLEGSKLTPSQVLMLAVHLALGTPTAIIARLAGVSGETVRDWRARLGSRA